MNGLVRKVNARFLERGANMQSVSVWLGVELSHLFADDIGLVANSSEKL